MRAEKLCIANVVYGNGKCICNRNTSYQVQVLYIINYLMIILKVLQRQHVHEIPAMHIFWKLIYRLLYKIHHNSIILNTLVYYYMYSAFLICLLMQIYGFCRFAMEPDHSWPRGRHGWNSDGLRSGLREGDIQSARRMHHSGSPSHKFRPNRPVWDVSFVSYTVLYFSHFIDFMGN